MASIKKNFIYNLLYEILILLLPLITVPYVSRVLGVEGIGIYSYTYSVVYYFMIFSMIGVKNYGNRTVAKVRDNKELLSKNFFSIYYIQLCMSLLMIIFYVAYILIFLKDYKLIATVQIIYLFSCMFDINWFFFGLEKFKLTVTRNIILKIISLLLIFVFVNDKSDLLEYTMILSLSALFSQLFLFTKLKKEIKFVKIKFIDVREKIKPCLVLFIPTIAVSLYKVMDKIMLGNMINASEVGYYEQAEKIIQIVVSISAALATIMLPRMSNLLAKGNIETVKKYINKSIKFTMFLAFPMSIGLLSISSEFIPIFLGQEFTKSSLILNLLAITIPILSFANVIRSQYLIPTEQDRHFIISVIGGAIVNLIANIILIPVLQSVGAAIGTILAELFVMIYQLVAIRKKLPIFKYIKDIVPFLINSIIMFFVIGLVNYLDISQLYSFILKICVGVLIYLVLNIKYINSIINLQVLKKIFRKKCLK